MNRTRQPASPAMHQRKASLMIQTDGLPDQQLGVLAAEWRRRALHGDVQARGIAHELEAELRRRSGGPVSAYDTLDTRSLESRHPRTPWWSFWRRDDIAQRRRHIGS